MGQIKVSPFDVEFAWGQIVQWWAFLLLFDRVSSLKVPSGRCTTGFPDATWKRPRRFQCSWPGGLLKMAGTGSSASAIRCVPTRVRTGLARLRLGVGEHGLRAFAAMAQKDFPSAWCLQLG